MSLSFDVFCAGKTIPRVELAALIDRGLIRQSGELLTRRGRSLWRARLARDERSDLGWTTALHLYCPLPHKNCEGRYSVSEGDWSAELERPDGGLLPCGKLARLVCDLIIGELASGRPWASISLGDTLRESLARLGIHGDGGGARGPLARLKEQLSRLAKTKWTVRSPDGDRTFRILTGYSCEPHEGIRLSVDPGYVDQIGTSLIPYRRSTLIGGGIDSSTALDLYRWATWRAWRAEGRRRVAIKLRQLFESWGAGWGRIRDWVRHRRDLANRLAEFWAHPLRFERGALIIDLRLGVADAAPPAPKHGPSPDPKHNARLPNGGSREGPPTPPTADLLEEMRALGRGKP